jgi:protoheme IX farnesyltransferase
MARSFIGTTPQPPPRDELTVTTRSIASDESEARASSPAGRAWLELTKPGLTGLVVATSSLGYLLARPDPLDWGRLAAVTAGTALVGGGANALNQWAESEQDAVMNRTRGRPIPSGRLAARAGFVFAAALTLAGIVLLAAAVNALTSALAFASWAIYLFAYTPMKRRSTLNTIVGAVSGAIPPVLGWTAATGSLDARALVLFAILFLWQIPHFLAIAWIHREDYARGGFRMLPISDPEGRTTFRIALMYTFALIPVTLSAAAVGLSGWVYAVGALALGIVLLAAALRLQHECTKQAARRLFFLTIAYLPAILMLMLVDTTRLPARLG